MLLIVLNYLGLTSKGLQSMGSVKSFLQFINVGIFTCITVTGCMVGPDFHSPAAPHVHKYTENKLPAKTVSTAFVGSAGKSQVFVNGKDISSEWWTLFHSKELNELITVALANNQNLSAAYATLRQAQETLNAQIGNSLFPAVNTEFTSQRQLFSSSSLGGGSASSLFYLYNANANVSYTLDLFGGQRRQIEALRAQVDYQQFELIAAWLTLTANVVTTAVTIASLEAQIKTTHALIASQESTLKILSQQFQLGAISKSTVLTQETLVDQTRATLPPLEKSLSQSKHALTTLIGAFPEQQLPKITLDKLNLPAKLPVSLPSRLVRQRPDVRAYEALLHAASANIGVATANLLPQVSLTGTYGYESLSFPALIGPQSKVWEVLGSVTQPIFHGGALFAQRREAIAAYDYAAAQYKQTVLTAFQNVADSLRAIETDARALRADREAEVAARKNLYLSKEQYRLGGASYLILLTAQQQYESTVLTRIQAQAARYSDTAALFQALGGGWWNEKWCVNECV